MRAQLCILLITLLSVSADIPQEFKIGNARFSAKLYKEVAKEYDNKNFVFCPINVQIMMAALSSADISGNSATVNQIRQIVELPSTNSKTEECFAEVKSQLSQNRNDIKIFNFLKMYMNPNYEVQPWYTSLLRKKFGADVSKIDFSNPNAVKDVNDWVSQKTNNKITDLFKPGSLSADSQVVLIDILYFLGKWTIPFDETKNEVLPFKNIYNAVFNATMMVRDGAHFYYYEDDKAKYLKMPIEGDYNEMVFVLPKLPYTLKDVEQQNVYNGESLDYRYIEVNVKLPKFNITTDVKMKKILTQIGLTKVFDWKNGELSGLSRTDHPYVKITDMFQKSKIEVSESGVVATSAFISQSVSDAAYDLDEKTFVADHPFLFYITSDDLVVFTGRVVDL